MALLRVLQIIHITDLHCKHIAANAVQRLNAKKRYLARFLQHKIERYDLFGWNEGTQGHYRRAPESFARFLQEWRARDDQWYGEPGSDSAQTWLIDTGDLTAFGDEASVNAGRGHVGAFRAVLGDCAWRSLYGNHDAWPEMLPVHAILGYLPGDIAAQRQKLERVPEWRTAQWLTDHLSVPIPGTEAYGGARIELYALDTVCWGALSNTLAVGDLARSDFDVLRGKLRAQWQASNTSHFRILALHHPLAFPYEFDENHALHVFGAMHLKGAESWGHEFRNDRNDPAQFGPLVHLFLSGHTHAAYPAGPLPGNVEEIYQGALGPPQLQLVGGPLMLNRSAKAVQGAGQPRGLVDRTKSRYVPGTLDPGNCQAQILRFFADSERPGELTMIRIPVGSVDGSVYVAGDPVAVSMAYDARRAAPGRP